jgi:hypothetical protein
VAYPGANPTGTYPPSDHVGPVLPKLSPGAPSPERWCQNPYRNQSTELRVAVGEIPPEEAVAVALCRSRECSAVDFRALGADVEVRTPVVQRSWCLEQQLFDNSGPALDASVVENLLWLSSHGP